METINCRHTESNGKACRRVSYRNQFYCYAHKHLYPNTETRSAYEKRKKSQSEEEFNPKPLVREVEIKNSLQGEIAELAPDKVTGETPSNVSKWDGAPIWDNVQKEEGWWDDALPDATPEEQIKEALANAEVAERSLKAEEIYTLASLGREVTDEMFGKDRSSSMWSSAITWTGVLLAIPFLPTLAMVFLLAMMGGGGHSTSDIPGFDANESISALSGALWKPHFFAAFASWGTWLGLINHRNRSQALKNGKADYLASQEAN